MAIQIDDDWKKQAQAEKKKLAEREAAAKAPPPAAPAAEPSPVPKAIPEASFATLVQTLMSQTLYYLGEMAYDGEQPVLNLDLAGQQIKTLAILEEKTKGNLTAEETSLLDQVLYDLRSRFVSVARQMIV